MSLHVPEKYRNGAGFLPKGDPWWTPPGAGNNGVFFLPMQRKVKAGRLRYYLKVICSDGEQWEHVSVSMPDRCPTWPEMCHVKGLFWDPEDCVIQYHPPASTYVNHHPYVLHLWRPDGIQIPTPPTYMIGPDEDIKGAR